jgi:hypothetical protein
MTSVCVQAAGQSSVVKLDLEVQRGCSVSAPHTLLILLQRSQAELGRANEKCQQLLTKINGLTEELEVLTSA